MSKLISYWESYDRFYDDFQKEGLSFDDLLLKSKLIFLDSKFTFSSKSKFNFERAAVAHEVGLKVKQKKYTIELKQKQGGEVSIESENEIWKNDKFMIGSLVNCNILQSERNYENDSKVQLRFHYKDNSLFTFGVENWNKTKYPKNNFVLGGSFGKNTNESIIIHNVLFNYSIEHKFIQSIKLLRRYENKDFTKAFLVNIQRSRIEDSSNINNAFDLTALFTKQICPGLKVGGLISHEIDSQRTTTELVLSKKIDKVRLNAKINNKSEISVGLTSSYDDITINLCAKSTFKSKTIENSEKIIKEVKFGSSIEFNRL